MYGITKQDRMYLKTKLKFQRDYLDNNYLSVDGVSLPYSTFYFSSWHNPSRYIAELNNRVASLNKYANDRGLKCIFAVLTLPSEYHRKKSIKTKGGLRLVNNSNFIDDKNHTVKAGSDKLQSVVRSILNSTVFREIPKKDRVYITTKEPHKDGTCHLNFMCFVPENFVDRCVKAIKRRFLSQQNTIETNIKNPTSYIMKYIFKTLDDLRGNPSLDNLTDITYWYMKHKIRRVTMSRTFVSLEIYRKLNGQYDLISLTKNYNKGFITVLINPQTKKVEQIFDEFGEIWQKRIIKQPAKETPINWQEVKENIHNVKRDKFIQKFTKELNKFLSKNSLIPYEKQSILDMSDFRLIDYYINTNHTKENIQRLGILENEMIRRGFTNFTRNYELIDINNIEELENYFGNKGFTELPF
ncbi:replication endonuclease [Campylobacter sp. FMV-PI01]|uniref:Replication endonuclease n=1 Tax=Campylobacter portucalensis TaxID=2608384 RepID=A0A6L5WJH3_9BACT|nr:replication endonuclease [Campylobacter portucalensis]MSN95993.1 replication endonuclease [Campylobacter portucalensis]